MLFVLFSADQDRFAISSRQIEEVVPFARLKSMPHAHPAFSGLLNYRGTPIPVLDFNRLLGLPPVEASYVSRIMLCNVPQDDGECRLLGLLAAQVTETRNLPEIQFIEPGVHSPNSSYIGRIYEEKDGSYLQWIHPEKILPREVWEELNQTVQELS